ncbi:MAG: flagellar FliJ family protein [Nocardioides sp.]
MGTSPDSHLQVVARVRGVRERDSRIGLVEALAEEQAAADRVVSLQERLAAVPAPADGDPSAYAFRQRTLDDIGHALGTARTTQASATLVTLAARERWHTDRSRLAAVESLLERREAARREEQRRRETRELDAVAEDLWRRHHPEDPA